MGLDIIPTRSFGQTINETFWNVFKSVLSQDFVPRDSTGTPQAVGGSLGTSTYPWLKLFLGAAASGLSVEEESAGVLIIKVGGTAKFRVSSAGVDGALLKAVSVATGALIDQSVTTAKLADGAVTIGKMTGAGYIESAGSGSVSFNSTSFTSLFLAAINKQTVNSGLWITLVPDGATTNGSLIWGGSSSTVGKLRFSVTGPGGSGFFQAYYSGFFGQCGVAPGAFSISIPAGVVPAGTNTIACDVQVQSASFPVNVEYCKLVAKEIL